MTKLSIFLLSSLFFLQMNLSSEEIGGVQFSFKSDKRNWKEINRVQQDPVEMATYVIEGETADNWSELVTVQFIKDMKVEPAKFFEMFVKQLGQMEPNSKIGSKILSESNDSLLGEWWLKENTPNDQLEWIRIIQKQNGVVILRYTTKKKDNKEAAKIWEEILKDAK